MSLGLRRVERPLLHAHRNAILKSHAAPEAIGEMVAALGDADERIRWLAGSALASLKDARVVEAVRAFSERTKSAEGRLAAHKLLAQLTSPPAET